jgi:hypothetical protein
MLLLAAIVDAAATPVLTCGAAEGECCTVEGFVAGAGRDGTEAGACPTAVVVTVIKRLKDKDDIVRLLTNRGKNIFYT